MSALGPTTDIAAFVNSIVLFFKVQILGDPAAAGPLWNSYISKASFILFLNVVCPSCCCEQLIERDFRSLSCRQSLPNGPFELIGMRPRLVKCYVLGTKQRRR